MTMPALILVAVAVGLPGAPASPRGGGDPPAKEQIEASAQKIKELKKERIATLKERLEILTKLVAVNPGRDYYGDAIEAKLLLLRAELDAAEKGADRIALYKGAIDLLKMYEDLAKTRMAAGRGTEATLLEIKARRLEVEIQLEQEKLKQAKEGK